MTTFIRPAEIVKEKVALTAFLTAHLSPDADKTRYDWLYHQNPDGAARVWVACDSETQQMIGVAAAFPRRARCGGREVRAYVLGDFCIHREFRTLGPALALQRMCLEDLSKGDAEFVFDFPSSSMLAIYKRLHMEPCEGMIRFAKPLRVDRRLKLWIPNEVIARSLATAANLGLRLRDIGSRRASTWVIEEQTASCGEEFTVAALEWSGRMGVCVTRSADYLNWRYLQHPQKRYRFLTARKDGRLCGFLIYHLAEEDPAIVDLLGRDNAVCEALLSATVSLMRVQRVQTLSAPFFSAHPSRKLLEALGFRPRESSPVVLLRLKKPLDHREDKQNEQWYLTHGDRES